MISLRKAATDLERLEELCQALAKCYGLAIQSSAEYAVELEPRNTEYFRQRLHLLEERCKQAGSPEQYHAVQASLREELRNYRDQGRQHMTAMRQELNSAVAAMRVLADNVSTSGDEHETQLHREVGRLESVAASEDLKLIRKGITSASGAIVQACGQLRRSHQLVVSQLQDEIRTLHQAMDSERGKVDRDYASGAWSRQKINERINHLLRDNEPFCVLLINVKNLRSLGRQHPPAVITDALKALVKEFDGILGGGSMIGRWSEDIFCSVLEMDPSVALSLSADVKRKLSLSYPIWTSGVAQILTMETSTGIVDRRKDSDPSNFYRKLEQMATAMTGPAA